MGKTVPPSDEMQCTSHRVEGRKRWLKNERRGVDHQLRNAQKQMEQAASGTAIESGHRLSGNRFLRVGAGGGWAFAGSGPGSHGVPAPAAFLFFVLFLKWLKNHREILLHQLRKSETARPPLNLSTPEWVAAGAGHRLSGNRFLRVGAGGGRAFVGWGPGSLGVLAPVAFRGDT